jgi:UDP-3-O-[3-hydroxymyristoyl] glucosamine N-acyltransferase
MKLKEIAEIINGRIIGRDDIDITGVSGITDAKDGEITFLSDKRYLKDLMNSDAAAVILKEPIEGLKKSFVIVENPLYAFAKLLSFFHKKTRDFEGIHKNTYISDRASISKDVTIYPFVYIADDVTIETGTVLFPGVYVGERSYIGKNCLIYPNVTIREDVKIGDNVIIHSGSVIGADGFGYVFDSGIHHKIPQIGGVIIEDDVEIGANSTIDRATTGNTVIGKGSKIDNLVQIGHNVKIGENTILVAQVGIGGSSFIGNYCVLGGQVGVSDHADVETGTMVGAKSGIMPGKLSKGIYSGIPVIHHKEWLKAVSIFSKLPDIYKRIKELEDKIKQSEEKS